MCVCACTFIFVGGRDIIESPVWVGDGVSLGAVAVQEVLWLSGTVAVQEVLRLPGAVAVHVLRLPGAVAVHALRLPRSVVTVRTRLKEGEFASCYDSFYTADIVSYTYKRSCAFLGMLRMFSF